GAIEKPTARAVGAAAQIVFTSLPGPAEFTDVTVGANGLLHGMSRGSELLDAPVSGGPKGAETRSLAIWVGGDEAIYRRHEALLRDIGDQPAYIGPIGVASVAKLVHNCAGYTIQAALAEVFTLGVKGGVDPVVLWRI